MARLLLHICCGPCSITVAQRLLEGDFAVTGLFYNPNIHPLTEYLRRREGVEQTASRLSIPVIYLDDEYDPAVFLRQTAFRENARCQACYALRLNRTASFASEHGFDLFSTTLLYSKRQNHDAIRLSGENAARGSTRFFYRDFREGWQEGIALSKDWGIYRQPYCGCLYSECERYRKRLSALQAAPAA
ncbi:MAG: epoxyqueuosine reductase QueH [Desulfovibrionaceae bacterium]|nr:epoxyqueuosine reductase QueH [Desulfovibrionaceae bacterium]MBF0512511.1 epoxyqueuosine reductase QueH [Desulfovibrionaceae bacterium]